MDQKHINIYIKMHKINIISGANNNTLKDMFQRFNLLGPKIPVASTSFIQLLQTTVRKNQNFFDVVEKWRYLEVSYMGKLAELQCDCTNKQKHHNNNMITQLHNFFQLMIKNHKILINKLNHDIFLSNIEPAKQSFASQKNLIEQEKSLHKELATKKQLFEKVLQKKSKLKKQLGEQQTLQIFSQDSYEEGVDKRMKRFLKIKQISKEQDQYDIKVQQTKQYFDKIIEQSHENTVKFNKLTALLNSQKEDIIIKINLHVLNFSKSLVSEFQENCQKISTVFQDGCPDMEIKNQYIKEEEYSLKEMDPCYYGYLDNCLKLISDKTLDQIIQYSKDNEIKKKIKRIIESDSINPEDTDQLTRQVQLFKKILANSCDNPQCVNHFRCIIQKNSKLRLNFIFILQLNRLKNKFEIAQEDIKPLLTLINQLLTTSHQSKDAYVIKQLMILLSTYYVKIEENGEEQKIYILNFFKNYSFWKDFELWESILIQCIYIEKKATIRMLLITSSTSNKSELIEAEKTSVLNQILYIVRNMLLFNFNEKQVKDFANRFVKLMKQDDKFLKDVHKSIEIAIREEKEAMPSQYSKQIVQDLRNQIFGPQENLQKLLKVHSNPY